MTPDNELLKRYATQRDESSFAELVRPQVHAYCLMSNHFHLVIETPSPNLVEGMKWFPGVYTRRFNLRHKLFGHLFSGRNRLPQNCVRLRAPQSRPGWTAQSGSALGGLSLEQLSAVRLRYRTATRVVASRPFTR